MANLLYHHVQLEAQRLAYFDDNAIEVSEEVHGSFTDSQLQAILVNMVTLSLTHY